ncbi:hypothetical protein WJX72_007477 [[Myrmecia] bisecta]|uniref:Alpha-mannosidase n=1 Tax=[Myrmecia] bisecta TaxID=41462 RepID=A0AAW1PQ68_9CHLO
MKGHWGGLLLAAVFCCCQGALARSCGVPIYNTTSSRVPDKLNVHIVPHTHDDAGWLKTVDQYYYGSQNQIQLVGVQYVLDSIITELQKNPDRKFIYGEMAFFSTWWHEQTNATKTVVRELVRKGQLDFINGGWVQNDEAAAHYVSMIDQTTRGHRFLMETFGKMPRVGWQIDPFGHSATQASLMAGVLGFDALFFGRADYQDMDIRKPKKQMELLWRGAESYGEDADIFTGNFWSGNYGPPPGFWFEWGQTNDAPVMDNTCLMDYNVKQRVDEFVLWAQNYANVTVGNDVMFTLGSDFTYATALMWYKNLDKLIHYVNLDGRVNAFYSTPANYTDAKHAYNASWPLKQDDFFPYADCPVCYWTGYFTSRAASKGFIRSSSAYLQAARQLEHVAGVIPEGPNTDALEAAVSLCQHHDSITGTEKQAVTEDYHQRLHKGLVEAEQLVLNTLSNLIFGTPSGPSNPKPAGRRLLAPVAPLQTSPEGMPREPPAPRPVNPQQAATEAATEAAVIGTTASAASAAEPDGSTATAPATAAATPPSAPVCDKPADPNAEDHYQMTAAEAAAVAAIGLAAAAADRANSNVDAWTDVGLDSDVKLQHCRLLNASVCAASVSLSKAQGGLLVVVYNSLAWNRSQAVRVPLDTSALNASWTVTGPSGPVVPAQLLPVSASTQQLQRSLARADALPDQTAAASIELVFMAHVPPLGYSVYTLQKKAKPTSGGGSGTVAGSDPSTDTTAQHSVVAEYNMPAEGSNGRPGTPNDEDVVVSNGRVALNLSTTTGRITHFANTKANLSIALETGVLWYKAGEAHAGGVDGAPEGAYLFRPDGRFEDTEAPVAVQVVKGPVVNEIRQAFSPWAALTTRLWAGAPYAEVEWTAGPIPFADGSGKSVMVKYASSLNSSDTFYTDANGREMQKRRGDFRPTWPLNVTQPVAGNFYPLTAAIALQEPGKAELAVITDRAQGGSSLVSGELQLNVHRRTLFDDQRGVAEPLNETMCGCRDCACEGLIVRGTHLLSLQPLATAPVARRTLQQTLNDPVIVAFGPLPGPAVEPRSASLASKLAGGAAHLGLPAALSALWPGHAVQDGEIRTKWSALPQNMTLPPNVHLLTLQRLPDNSTLLRLAHLYQVGEDRSGNLSKPVTVDLASLFPPNSIKAVHERSLSTVKSPTELSRLKFRAGPMEIKTFFLQFADGKPSAGMDVAASR